MAQAHDNFVSARTLQQNPRGNAVGQRQKRPQAAQLVAAIELNVIPALGARDHRTHRDDQDVDQPMIDLSRTLVQK
jgi:hypothetical protein